MEVGLRVDAKGVQGTHAGVGLGDDGVAGLADQRPGLRRVVYDPAARHPDSGRVEKLLHHRFAADEVDIRGADAGDVEIVPNAGLGAEPVFVQRVETVDLAVAVGEIPAGPEERVVVVHVADEVILRQCGTQLLRQPLVGFIADAEGVRAGLFHAQPEAVVVGWKMRGQYHDVPVHDTCPVCRTAAAMERISASFSERKMYRCRPMMPEKTGGFSANSTRHWPKRARISAWLKV